MKSKSKRYIITVKYFSKDGSRPDFRALCGDTLFLTCKDGDTATSVVKLIRKKKRIVKNKNCRCGAAGEPDHSCPYQSDVNGDDQTMCNCCHDCQHNCAMDI